LQSSALVSADLPSLLGDDDHERGPLLYDVVAALADARLEAILPRLIASKRAAGRPRDKAVLELLETTLREKGQAR
jgi:hypothetical protein